MLDTKIFSVGKYEEKNLTKFGIIKMGGFPETGPPKFWTFKPLETDALKFQKKGRY